MHYQVFIPDESGPSTAPKALERVGLSDLVPGHEGMHKQGPDGKLGQLICWRKPGVNQPFHFNAAEQTWIPALPNGPDGAGRGRYYVGLWNDHPVEPEDLRRPEADYGAPIILGDRQTWILPTVRSFIRDIKRNPETGEWHYPIQTKFHEAYFGAKQWANRLLAQEDDIPFGEIAAFIESVLQLNYRILPEVSDHLGLINTENVGTCLMTIINVAGAGEESDEQ